MTKPKRQPDAPLTPAGAVSEGRGLKAGPTSGDVGRSLQSIAGLYTVNGVALPFEIAPRGSQLRKEAAEALRTLRKLDLNRAQTLVLREALRTEVARDRIVSTWPTVGDDRKALNQLAASAIKLRQQLLELSPKAVMYLHSGAHDLNADDAIPGALMTDLFRLAACVHHADRTYLPPQSRKGHHANVVEAVARVVRPLGMKASASPTSHFWKACAAAFVLADITSQFKEKRQRPSPGASIRALLDSEGHHRRGKFWHLE